MSVLVLVTASVSAGLISVRATDQAERAMPELAAVIARNLRIAGRAAAPAAEARCSRDCVNLSVRLSDDDAYVLDLDRGADRVSATISLRGTSASEFERAHAVALRALSLLERLAAGPPSRRRARIPGSASTHATARRPPTGPPPATAASAPGVIVRIPLAPPAPVVLASTEPEPTRAGASSDQMRAAPDGAPQVGVAVTSPVSARSPAGLAFTLGALGSVLGGSDETLSVGGTVLLTAVWHGRFGGSIASSYFRLHPPRNSEAAHGMLLDFAVSSPVPGVSALRLGAGAEAAMVVLRDVSDSPVQVSFGPILELGTRVPFSRWAVVVNVRSAFHPRLLHLSGDRGNYEYPTWSVAGSLGFELEVF